MLVVYQSFSITAVLIFLSMRFFERLTGNSGNVLEQAEELAFPYFVPSSQSETLGSLKLAAEANSWCHVEDNARLMKVVQAAEGAYQTAGLDFPDDYEDKLRKALFNSN